MFNEKRMRKLFLLILTFLQSFYLFAQIEPIQSSDQEIKTLKVSKLSTYYFPSKDTTKHAGQLILEKEFNTEGIITNKYLFSLWEAVSYSKKSSFEYNEKNQLVETRTIQTILNLNERDAEYIAAFGDKPLNEKLRYKYDLDGKLIKKEIFTFSTPELSEAAVPNQTIVYSYQDSLLIEEESSSIDKGIFNQNFTVSYTYTAHGNLSKKTMNYGPDFKNKRISEYWYDGSNNVIEEKISDTGVSRNNGHFKYEYDEKGLRKNKLVFDAESQDFVVDINYTYDTKGNMTSGERDVFFEYAENGLIRSELWKDAISDQVFYFVTRYDYW